MGARRPTKAVESLIVIVYVFFKNHSSSFLQKKDRPNCFNEDILKAVFFFNKSGLFQNVYAAAVVSQGPRSRHPHPFLYSTTSWSKPQDIYSVYAAGGFLQA